MSPSQQAFSHMGGKPLGKEGAVRHGPVEEQDEGQYKSELNSCETSNIAMLENTVPILVIKISAQ